VPDIELHNVSKSFEGGKVMAMDHVNLTIHHGEYVFLLGPSGCGKTTTLRVISGLEQPDEGEVLIDGQDVKHLLPEDRGMGFVFQHFEIFPFMTVWENTVYGLEVRGFADDAIIEQGEKALKMVGLLDYADLYPSGFGNPGMQRLGIARAIATGAKFLVMDEPLGSLDPKSRLVFRHELRDLVKSLGLTAIHVTHDQDEALAIGDQLIIMRQGRILQEGTPEYLYNNPDTIFVANFVGEMNFLEGFIYPDSRDDQYFIRLRIRGPKLYASKTRAKESDFQVDQRVLIAFRFEDVYVFPENFDFEDPRYEQTKAELIFVPARLVTMRFIGKTTRFIAELSNGDQVQAIKPGTFRHQLVPGDNILLGIHPEDIITFKPPEHELANELALS